MKKQSFVLLIFMALSLTAIAQVTPVVKLEEDYTKPKSYMWKEGDEYGPRSVENGMYVGKGGTLPAELEFPFEMDDRQKSFKSVSDIEFTIVKVKGKETDFISVYLYAPRNKITAYLNFGYNELGEWKLGNHKYGTIFKSGKTAVNAGTNIVRVEHRYGKLQYYVNDELVTEFDFETTEEIKWREMKIEAQEKKMVIALDKAVFMGYSEKIPFTNEAKIAAVEAAKPRYREVPYEYKDVRFFQFKDDNGKMGVMNNSGLVIAPGKYDQIGFYAHTDLFEDGLAVVSLNERWGFIDTTGKEVVKRGYLEAKDFTEGLAAVYNGKWGFINTKGETVIPHEYTGVSFFSEGLVIATKSEDFENWGVLDKTGKTVIDFKYFELGNYFMKGIIPFSTSEYKYGYLDKTGKIVCEAKYDYAAEFEEQLGWGSVSLDKKRGYVDATGKVVIPLVYQEVYDSREKGILIVKQNDKAWLMDYSQKQIGDKYDVVHEFFEGLAAVSANEKIGFIDKTGKLVIPVIYGKYSNPFFDNGTAEVVLDGRRFKIDKSGNEVK